MRHDRPFPCIQHGKQILQPLVLVNQQLWLGVWKFEIRSVVMIHTTAWLKYSVGGCWVLMSVKNASFRTIDSKEPCDSHYLWGSWSLNYAGCLTDTLIDFSHCAILESGSGERESAMARLKGTLLQHFHFDGTKVWRGPLLLVISLISDSHC